MKQQEEKKVRKNVLVDEVIDEKGAWQFRFHSYGLECVFTYLVTFIGYGSGNIGVQEKFLIPGIRSGDKLDKLYAYGAASHSPTEKPEIKLYAVRDGVKIKGVRRVKVDEDD